MTPLIVLENTHANTPTPTHAHTLSLSHLLFSPRGCIPVMEKHDVFVPRSIVLLNLYTLRGFLRCQHRYRVVSICFDSVHILHISSWFHNKVDFEAVPCASGFFSCLTPKSCRCFESTPPPELTFFGGFKKTQNPCVFLKTGKNRFL